MRCFSLRHVFVVLSLCAAVAHSPAERSESANQSVTPAPSDTARVRVLNETARRFWLGSAFDSTRRYAYEALMLAQKLNDKRGEAISNRILGQTFKYLGPRATQVKHLDTSLTLFKELGDMQESAEALRLLAVAYIGMGHEGKGDEMLRQALTVFTRYDHQEGIARTLAWMSVLPGRRGDHETARQYLQRALRICDSLQYVEAKVSALGLLGESFRASHDYSAAARIFREELALAEKLGVPLLVGDVHSDLSLVYIELKQYDDAIRHLRRALDTFGRTGAKIYAQIAYSRLAVAYAGKGDFKLAYAYNELSRTLHSEMYDEHLRPELEAVQTKFEIEKRELARQHDKEELTGRLYTLALIAFLAIALLILRDRAKRRANRVLAEKNTVIGEQKRELEQRLIELHNAKDALNRANAELEKKVLDRTTELFLTNKELDKSLNERKELEEHVLQLQKMESLGTLAGGIAHDFNNILSIILAHASVLEEQREHIVQFSKRTDAILKATNRGASLVRQLLTFARRANSNSEPINLNDSITELSHMLQETFPKTTLLHLDLAAHLPAVNGDRTQIHQALLNLCVNARDAMPSGGRITIRTGVIEYCALQKIFPSALETDYVCITVADTGTGMDQATRQRIFEPFFTTKHFGRGTGLGLAVTYGVLSSHRGFIDVQSEVGRGTTFFLYLPCVPAPALTVPSDPDDNEQTHGSGETILVIEDEPDLLEMMTSLLVSNGYTVLMAHDGAEALDVIAKNTAVDLVLSDVGLPKIDGWEAYKRMSVAHPDLKIIFASGFFDPEKRSEMLQFGVKHLIQKPYKPMDVVRIIRAVLDESRVEA